MAVTRCDEKFVFLCHYEVDHLCAWECGDSDRFESEEVRNGKV